MSEIFSEKDRITAEFLTDQAVRIKELERENEQLKRFNVELRGIIDDFSKYRDELERVLENLCIHVGMGWETDEMLEQARAVLEKKG